MLADARARVPDLEGADHDSRADQDWLERLLDGCIRYTPTVALDAPDGLTLDITGCEHLFGGEGSLIKDIEFRMARLGMTLRPATALSPDTAQALARFQTAPATDETWAVRGLTVAALRQAMENEQALLRDGTKNEGEVGGPQME